MTIKKQLDIKQRASILYKVFPTEKITVNHKSMVEVCDIIQRISQYKGHTRGLEALPTELLENKYQQFWSRLQELRELLDREKEAYKQTARAIDEAEMLLDWIFMAHS